MRRVTETRFCEPCMEGLWLQLLRRVDLIDSVSLECDSTAPNPKATITIHLLPLAGLRNVPVSEETFTTKWWKDGEPIPLRDNATALNIWGAGLYEVEVHLATPDVRKDPTGLLTSRWAMVVLDVYRGCPTLTVVD